MKSQKNCARRAARVRYKLRQNSEDRLRLSVFRSLQHMHVQAIDDVKGITVASATTNSKDCKLGKASKTEKAKWVGAEIAKKLNEKKVKLVYLDRGSYAYHGAVKALADAAREAGLSF